MALSEFAIRKAKSKEKPYRLSDGDGLHLLIQPSGSKAWQLRYRYQGKENILSFGKYPLVTLAEARQKRDVARKQLLEGIDPSAQRKLDKIAAATAARQTFGLIADEYIENLARSGVTESTVKKKTWLLKDLAAPLGKRPIADIHPAEILDLLKRIELSGRNDTALRLRGTISSVFKLAIVTLRANENPTIPLHGALISSKPKSRAAITDERKLGVLWSDIDDYDGWPTIRLGLKFLMLTCVRPGEVRGAVRSEFNLDKAVWRISPDRMKMRQPHNVPLSRQALDVLREVWPLSDHGELVFPSIRSNRRPLSENAFNSALRRMGYSKEEVTAHGFRASASSILNDRGYDPDVIEAALAHQDQDSVRRAYNRATYWNQRVVLMQEWADLLDQVKEWRR